MRGNFDLEMVDVFSKTLNKIQKYQQIEKIIRECEQFCEYDNHESTYSCRCAMLKAYRDIAEIVGVQDAGN